MSVRFSSRDMALPSLRPATQRPAPVSAQPSSVASTAPTQAPAFASAQVLRAQFGNSIAEANIPIVDLREYVSGTPAQKMAFANKLGTGLKEYGFVALKGHGIPVQLFNKNYQRMSEVFALPEQVKQQYERPEIGRQRGWLPAIELKANKLGEVKNRPDHKECWHSGRTENVFPREVPSYEAVNQKLFKDMEKAGVQLLEALGLYLNDGGYLKWLVTDDKTQAPNGTHLMRSIWYPEAPQQALQSMKPDEKFIRAGEHKDMNLITLLPQATASGLEIQRRDGTWLPIFAQEGHIIVNAADMLALITKGHPKAIPSTLHRVVGDQQSARKERFSIPMFMHPHHYKPLKNLATGQPVKAFEGTEQEDTMDEAGKYVYRRLQNHGALDKAMPYSQFRANNAQFIASNSQ